MFYNGNAQMEQGAVVIHLLVLLMMFHATAVLCDEFFEPCLALICENLNLKPDVAGESRRRADDARRVALECARRRA